MILCHHSIGRIAYGKRDAKLNRSVPETIVWILLGAFLVATAFGYASGVTGHRPSLVAHLLVAVCHLGSRST
jgi:hypothetical protein